MISFNREKACASVSTEADEFSLRTAFLGVATRFVAIVIAKDWLDNQA